MATISDLRHLNERKIIHTIMRLRTASRAQLSRESGLSQPTVGRIVDDLMDRSILAKAARRNGSGDAVSSAEDQPQLGRPSTALELDRRRRFLAIQVGVNRTRVAVMPMGVSDADDWQLNFPTPPSAKGFEQALHEQVSKIVPRGLQACIISLPGVVDEREGRVLLSPNLHWTEKAHFPGMLSSFTRARILYVQEIRALALGQLAAEPNLQDFLLVDFGNGVGGAAVINGKLYEAPLPLSGEVGHTPVVGNQRPCSCGAIGCVETLVSRNGLLASAHEHGGPKTWPALVEQLCDRKLPKWMTNTLDAVATTIAGGVNLLGVRQVLLSGALGDVPPAVQYLANAVQQGAMWGRFGQVNCRFTRRRRMIGMISLAIDQVTLSGSHK
jgi:predicted NBD/HSP70 family sugar kinase